VPSVGRYTVDVLRLLGIAAGVTMVGLGTGLYFLTRKRSGGGGGAVA
jgi:hypothetical protein